MKHTKERLKLEALIPAEKNVRAHPEEQVKELARSVEMFKQLRPIVVDENNMILAGNGLWEAMKQLGLKEADVLRITGMTEAEKKKLMLADNRIFDLGIDDTNMIFEFLESLDGDLDIPGFDTNVIEALLGTESEASDIITEYGKLDDDAIEEIRNRPEPGDYVESQEQEQDRQTVSVDEEGKYVVCPDCGKKIWL